MFPYGKAGGEAPRPAKWGPSGRWPTQGGVMFPFGKAGAEAGSSPRGVTAGSRGGRGTRGGGGAASGK